MAGRLSGRTVFITGASRGIGREIALKAASEGANVAIAAKSDTAHPKLPGTIHSVAEEVRALGARAIAIRLDVRDDASIAEAIEATAQAFGGLDAVVHNAGAIRLEPAARLEMKRFDLIHQINTRALLAVAKAALPLLETSDRAHVLSMAPPLNLDPRWLAPYIPYTLTKYGMTLLSMGLAEEWRGKGISVNTLWPRTMIATAAVTFEVGAEFAQRARRPTIVADAACAILASPAGETTGRALIDEEVLRSRGQTDFDRYRDDPGGPELALDLFVDA